MDDLRMFDFSSCIFTEDAQQILLAAEHSAEESGADCIRTEHLILGFLADPRRRSGRLLRKGGVTADQIIRNAQRIRYHEAPCPITLAGRKLPLSAELRNVVHRSYRGRRKQTDTEITEFALLAALLAEGCSSGMFLLRRLYRNLDRLKQAFRNYLGAPKLASPSSPTIWERAPKTKVDATVYVDPSKRIYSPLPVPWSFNTRYSRRARQALDIAAEAAREHCVAWVGTAYLLFGLAKIPGSISRAVLTSLGAEPKIVKALIAELTPAEFRLVDGPVVPEPTKELKIIADRAARLAHDGIAESITPEHLLLAFLAEGKNNAVYLLHRMNIDPEQVFDDLHRALS